MELSSSRGSAAPSRGWVDAQRFSRDGPVAAGVARRCGRRWARRRRSALEHRGSNSPRPSATRRLPCARPRRATAAGANCRRPLSSSAQCLAPRPYGCASPTRSGSRISSMTTDSSRSRLSGTPGRLLLGQPARRDPRRIARHVDPRIAASPRSRFIPPHVRNGPADGSGPIRAFVPRRPPEPTG